MLWALVAHCRDDRMEETQWCRCDQGGISYLTRSCDFTTQGSKSIKFGFRSKISLHNTSVDPLHRPPATNQHPVEWVPKAGAPTSLHLRLFSSNIWRMSNNSNFYDANSGHIYAVSLGRHTCIRCRRNVTTSVASIKTKMENMTMAT